MSELLDAIKQWQATGPGHAYTVPCSKLSVARTLAAELESDHGWKCSVEEPDHDRWFCGAPHKLVTDADGSQRLLRVFPAVIVQRACKSAADTSSAVTSGEVDN